MAKNKKPMTLGDKWESEKDESLHIKGDDGSEKLIYPDGKVEWIKRPPKKRK